MRPAPRWLGILFFVALVGLFVAVILRSKSDERVYLLPGHEAPWIMYPMVPDVSAHDSTTSLITSFRKIFTVGDLSQRSVLRVSALQSFGITLNGVPVSVAPAPDWRSIREIDLNPTLRKGTNELLINVTNRAGPPLLTAVLQAGKEILRTDRTWAASCAAASWQPAHLAVEPQAIRPGNPAFLVDPRDLAKPGVERSQRYSVIAALRSHVWRHVAVILFCGAIVVVGLRAIETRGTKMEAVSRFVLAGTVLLWALLFWHNVRLVSPTVYGFDAKPHLGYIAYVQREHSLPGREQGWETHQPPLYYVTAAGFLSLLSARAESVAGVIALQGFSFICAVTQIFLSWASLGLLFPGELRKRLIGTAAVAFVPVQIYHAHYITNEGFLAALVTLAFYFLLRILRGENGGRFGAETSVALPKTNRFSSNRMLLAALLGLSLGATLLTKISALVIVPAVFAVLLVHLLSSAAAGNSGRRGGMAPALATVVVCAVACAAVCGWYYARYWTDITAPFDSQSRFAYGTGWWQEDGFRTASYYLRFGEAFAHPLYSGFHSFWDGLYSTWWGDGLCGGAIAANSKPPWDYDLVLAGYVIALLPAVCFLAGFAVVIWNALRQPNLAVLLLGCTVACFGAALFYFSLRAPGISQVRASFALMLLFPFGALVAIGMEMLLARGRVALIVTLTLFGWWICNSYTAHSVRRTSAQPYATEAAMLLRAGQFEPAANAAQEALRREPTHGLARSILIDSWTQLGRTNEARQLVSDALQRWPGDLMAHLDASFELAQSGRLDEAIAESKRAVDLGPDSPDATKQLVVLLSRAQRIPEALAACRDALRVRPLDKNLQAWLVELEQGRAPRL